MDIDKLIGKLTKEQIAEYESLARQRISNWLEMLRGDHSAIPLGLEPWQWEHVVKLLDKCAGNDEEIITFLMLFVGCFVDPQTGMIRLDLEGKS